METKTLERTIETTLEPLYYGQFSRIKISDGNMIHLPEDIYEILRWRNAPRHHRFEGEARLLHFVSHEYQIANDTKVTSIRCYDNKALLAHEKSLKYQKVYNSSIQARRMVILPDRLVERGHFESTVFIAATEDGETFNIWNNRYVFASAGFP